jgi:hypothetical protein
MPTKRTKISMPIQELKSEYDNQPQKISQDVGGLNSVSIRVKKTKKIPIHNQIIKESKKNKIFDEGIKRTYRRKNNYDANQKYRAYKTNVEQKLYENLVEAPEQSIVEAIHEAVSQLKKPSMKKIIKDANAENKDLDTSEIISHHDVVQPKSQEEKRATLLDAIDKQKEKTDASNTLKAVLKRQKDSENYSHDLDAKQKEEKRAILLDAIERRNPEKIKLKEDAKSTLTKAIKHRKERKEAQKEIFKKADENLEKIMKGNSLTKIQAAVRGKAAQNNMNEMSKAAKTIQRVVRNKAAKNNSSEVVSKPRYSIAPSEISNAPTEISPEKKGKGGRPRGSYGEQRIKNIMENQGKNHKAAVDSIKFAKYRNEHKEPPSYRELRNYYNINHK